MSRSYKKQSIIKDKPASGKRLGNKKFRRKTKQKAKTIKSIDWDSIEDPMLFPEDKSEVINDYDVCDWKSTITDKTDNYYIKLGLKPLRKGKKKKINK